MDIFGVAIGASAVSIATSHRFSNNTERDTYFITNPSELIENIYITSGEELQQYIKSVWEVVTPAIQGPQGTPGSDGKDGDKGDPGDKGTNATINGVNTLNILEGSNMSLKQEGNNLTIAVKTTNVAEKNNSLPITSAGVELIVGNIASILETI